MSSIIQRLANLGEDEERGDSEWLQQFKKFERTRVNIRDQIDRSQFLRSYSAYLKDAYCDFIALKLSFQRYDRVIVPPPAIHQVWRSHILDVEGYSKMAEIVGLTRIKYDVQVLSIERMQEFYAVSYSIMSNVYGRLYGEPARFWIPRANYSPEYEIYVTDNQGGCHSIFVNAEMKMNNLRAVAAHLIFQTEPQKILLAFGQARVNDSGESLEALGIIPGSVLNGLVLK